MRGAILFLIGYSIHLHKQGSVGYLLIDMPGHTINFKRELEYLNTLQRFEKIKPGLRRMRAIMDALGNPHRQFASIHISGTNGKGSTAAMLSASLTCAGLKTGLYTSPALCRFNERIRTNEKDIGDAALGSLIREVRLVNERHKINLSYFEFCTALAYLYFAREKIDLAVVEVGMGGANDATNVITPLVAIITNISLDHTRWLGSTTTAIAREKAGIIKRGVPLVTAERNPAIVSYFKKVCKQSQSHLYQIDDYLTVMPKGLKLGSQTFAIKQKKPLPANEYNQKTVQYVIPLIGSHQLDNARLAILTLFIVRATQNPLRQMAESPLSQLRPRQPAGLRWARQGDFSQSFNAIKQGFSRTRWPGRLQIFSRRPFILIDGAHNPAGAAALARALDEYPFPSPDVLLIGLKNDKDSSTFLKRIVPRCRHVIATEASYQPIPAEQLAVKIKPYLGSGSTIEAIPELSSALANARKSLRSKKMLLITGSLYLIGDTLRLLKKPKF